jgi:N-acetylglucosamine-6-phosphate deacetylase
VSELLVNGARHPATGEATALLLRDGLVAPAETASNRARKVSADGLWLSPGFIDLQLNGGFGHDFTAEPAAIRVIGTRLASTGVTAYLPTAVSADAGTYDAILDGWEAAATIPGAQPLGWHFEGPMLAPARTGAHDLAHLRMPIEVDINRWRRDAGVRMVTLAPELPGALDTIDRLRAAGVVVAAGHTDADAGCAATAIDHGVRYATHLFNAMRGLDPRQAGIGVRLLLRDEVTVGVIADGHHLDDATLELVWRAAGPERVSVVTDGIASLGEPPGAYSLGTMAVIVGPDRAARLADGRLAGATTTLPMALRNLRRATGCTIDRAVATVTRVPARLLELTDRGHLAPGARGDAVLFDDDFSVKAAIVGGEPMYVDEVLGWD